MRRFVVAVVLLLSAASAAFADPEKEITANEAALGRAMIARDVATLDRLVGDDWTAQNDSGVTTTKASFINDVKSGTLLVKSFQLHDVHVRILGNIAIVQGADDEQSTYAGVDGSGTYNWMDVWENRGGRWVAIASQLTKLAHK